MQGAWRDSSGILLCFFPVHQQESVSPKAALESLGFARQSSPLCFCLEKLGLPSEEEFLVASVQPSTSPRSTVRRREPPGMDLLRSVLIMGGGVQYF